MTLVLGSQLQMFIERMKREDDVQVRILKAAVLDY
jgi:hypothetical protein